jgi:hypothetical protein
MPKQIQLTETASLAEATNGMTGTKFRARLIEADVWGSSGFYSKACLESAATDRVFGKATPIFVDHPGVTESFDRPERSIRDLAGRLTTDAVCEADGLYADIEVHPHWAPVIEAMAGSIGMSIRAYAEVNQGEAQGRTGTLVTKFLESTSVDFVTAAGAGGRIVSSLMESARPAIVVERAIAHGVAEATANDTREALSAAIRAEYGDDDTWPWLRDFDETTCWFEISTSDAENTYAQTYTVDADTAAVTLTGVRSEVRAHTEYVPVTPVIPAAIEAAPNTPVVPAGNEKETTMPQIEEARLSQLEADSGRVPVLEAERNTAVEALAVATTERDDARTELAQTRARDIARPIAVRLVGESVSLPPVVASRVVEAALVTFALTEAGVLDEAAFTTSVEAARTLAETEVAQIAEALGAGKVTNFGDTASASTELTEAQREANYATAFGRPARTVKGA